MTAGVEVGFSLGSNLGDKAGVIGRALDTLVATGAVAELTVSRLYRTAPWGHVTDQDWFLNACAVGRTTLSPEALLEACKATERQLGRRDTVRWGPRVIDVDILYYGDLSLDTPGLTLPHRDMLNRAFVLVPLAEIQPERRIGPTTAALAAAAIGDAGITAEGRVPGR
ncbi:2-amino-4-hydroxy-6-hydroxymethyldihydropteridine diphosphokinase [Lichenihabitans sp. Uapishka_5]|uniref:2-amino-4-hydroxy-6- hydroxymethyldihydropteridine diphosphokinase n=1 Tax=Lichenihabitans sp. Uapishka_5 TaxID=3037302 RepID=UPI0029E7E1E0|nr:2-amino-4-hydroxy-6-hydroxymethyldihydropteridine diphosphokinase [Lichenihabitans sp. Uapishka_5]MDX7953761.1 2-amino-4-hydroxy-6-hydroxymethyldihydropteridine diphosphokinase [Lichenihabitans sp. Uapishka_5]